MEYTIKIIVILRKETIEQLMTASVLTLLTARNIEGISLISMVLLKDNISKVSFVGALTLRR